MSGCQLRVQGRLLTPTGEIADGTLLIAGEQLLYAGASADAPDLDHSRAAQVDGALIAAGFIDLHVHGACGHDVVDGTEEALALIAAAHARHGTTAFCPTVLASTPAVTMRALETIARATGAPEGQGAEVLGAHLEGPFLSPARAGAQPADCLRLPDIKLMEELLAAGAGRLRIVTLAPELPGALELVEMLVERGVVVSIGHSDATFEQAEQAIARGCRLATHVFNAMSPLHHRRPGVVGAVLDARALVAEVIADGVHVADPVLRLLRRVKGPDALALITDCIAALDGDARLGDRPVQVADRAARLPDGTLAGSVLTMEGAVRRFAAATGAPLCEVSRAASATPAGVLGLVDRGSLAAGQLADVVLLDERLEVQAVFVRGRPVYRLGG